MTDMLDAPFPSVTFRPAGSDTQIVLSNHGDPFDDGYGFVDLGVSLEGPHLSATGIVRMLEAQDSLTGFFDHLADAWKGWEGTRSWESIEHELSVGATHHAGGHIQLDVSLRPRRPGTWSASVSMTLEAGEEMAGLARETGRLLGQ